MWCERCKRVHSVRCAHVLGRGWPGLVTHPYLPLPLPLYPRPPWHCRHFDMLVNMLSVPADGVVEDVWALLQLLPTNPSVRSAMVTLGGALPAASLTASVRTLSGGQEGAGGTDKASAVAKLAADAGKRGGVAWGALLNGKAPLRLLYVATHTVCGPVLRVGGVAASSWLL